MGIERKGVWPPRGATLLGLVLALFGPPALAALTKEFRTLPLLLLGQAGLWALGLAVVGVVVFGERKGLASIGLRQPRWSSLLWSSLLWGFGTALVLLYVVSPIAGRLIEGLDSEAFAEGFARLSGRPVWYMVLAGITAGVVEEILFRGYLVERLGALSGRLLWGGVLAWAAFVFVHIPFWGFEAALFTSFGGAVLTALYVWKRDLWANMIAHGVTAIAQLLPLALLPPG